MLHIYLSSFQLVLRVSMVPTVHRSVRVRMELNVTSSLDNVCVPLVMSAIIVKRVRGEKGLCMYNCTWCNCVDIQTMYTIIEMVIREVKQDKTNAD